MARKETIGILGGFASGKATLINAILQYPFFGMYRQRHNTKIIKIQKSDTQTIEWLYRCFNEKQWQKSTCSLRHVKQKNIESIKVLVPCDLLSQINIYDYPAINSNEDFPSSDDVKKLDFGIIAIDAEYAEKRVHSDIIKFLSQVLNNKLLVLLNKSDLLDSPEELLEDFRNDLSIPSCIKLFPISARLELERILDRNKRDRMYGYTDERIKMMYLLDNYFTDFRNCIQQNHNTIIP